MIRILHPKIKQIFPKKGNCQLKFELIHINLPPPFLHPTSISKSKGKISKASCRYLMKISTRMYRYVDKTYKNRYEILNMLMTSA